MSRFVAVAREKEFVRKARSRKSLSIGEYQTLHRIADRAKPIIEGSIHDGFQAFKGRINLRDVVDAVRQGKLSKIESLIPFDKLEGDLEKLGKLRGKATVDAGTASAEFFNKTVPKLIPQIKNPRLAFDPANKRIAQAIKRSTAKLITQVGGETKDAITGIISQAMKRGLPPDESAKLIKRIIGLNAQQAQAVASFQERLVAEKLTGMTSTQRREVFRDHPNLSYLERRDRFLTGIQNKNIDSIVESYADRLLTNRADAIARTETINAVNEGQTELWDQASDEGILDKGRAKKEWIVTPDDATCPICLDLDGVQVDLDEEFDLITGGSVPRPVAHPLCRCAIGLVYV